MVLFKKRSYEVLTVITKKTILEHTNLFREDDGRLSLASSLTDAITTFQSGNPSMNVFIFLYAPAMPCVLKVSVSSNLPDLRSIIAKLKPCLFGLISLPSIWIDPTLSSQEAPSYGGSKQPIDLTNNLIGFILPANLRNQVIRVRV